MNPLHLIWIIPVSLFFLIALFLLFAVRVRIVYETAPEIGVGFGPGNVMIYPRPKKKKKAKVSTKDRPKQTKKKAESDKRKKHPSFLPPFTPETIFAYLKMVMDTLGNLLKQIRIPELKLHLTVGNEDAAKTAITYGTVSAAAGVVLPRLEETCRIREMDVWIEPDFTEGKQSISLDITISAILLLLVLCILKLGIRFLQYRRAYFKAHPISKKDKTNHTDAKKGGSTV